HGGLGAELWILLVWLAAVTGVTLAASLGRIDPSRLASSPDRAADRPWLLLSNSLVTQHPISLSLLALGGLTVGVLGACGARVALATALVGHVGSTLAAYALLGLVRLGEPGAFASLLSRPDYGVSAVSAAWLGAVAAVMWRRRGASLRGQL